MARIVEEKVAVFRERNDGPHRRLDLALGDRAVEVGHLTNRWGGLRPSVPEPVGRRPTAGSDRETAVGGAFGRSACEPQPRDRPPPNESHRGQRSARPKLRSGVGRPAPLSPRAAKGPRRKASEKLAQRFGGRFQPALPIGQGGTRHRIASDDARREVPLCADIRTRNKDVSTTMICTHVLRRGPLGVQSLLDRPA